MNATIDRKRISIFVAIAYGISIALGLAVYFGGGLFIRDPWDLVPSAVLL